MSNSKIIFTGDFCEVSILKISNDKFNEYKANGLPIASKNAIEWEKLANKLDAESTGSMLYSDSYRLDLEVEGSPLLDLKAKHGKEIKISNFPAISVVEDDSKNYLVQIRVSKGANYYYVVNGEFDPGKLSLSIKPEKLPGGQLLNSLLMEYEGNFFSYNYAYDSLKVSQIFIADAKGGTVALSAEDGEIPGGANVVGGEKNLTAWYPAEINPKRVGEYEVELLERAVWPMSAYINAEWSGRLWKNHLGKTIKIKQWRGLSSQA